MENNRGSYPTAMVGSDPERAGEENYFYVRPGCDASIIVQAAVDYIEALQSSPTTTIKEGEKC